MKNYKKLSKLICLIMAAVFMITTVTTPIYGTENISETQEENIPMTVEEEPEQERPQEYEKMASSWRFKDGYIVGEEEPMMYNARSIFIPWSKTPEGYINSKGEVIEGALYKGIDVSAWQENVNWDKVKADGIEYAILRCGFGSDYRDQDDGEFIRNVKECERLDIPYGIYLYSYADSLEKAKSEAQHTLRMIKEAGANPVFPIYYDLEDDITLKAGRENIIKFAETYCSIIEAAGYNAGVYATLTWWNKYLNSSSLDKYERWVAQWNYKCDYKGKYGMWQYTSNGFVDGIDGRVDVNFSYIEPKPLVGWYVRAGSKYYAYKDGSLATGYKKIGDYYYLFDSKGKMRTGTVNVGTKQYKLYSSGKACLHTAKVKTALNYRTGPSTNYKKKGTYKKGTTVYVIRTSNGWSELSTGYWVSSSYLTKSIIYPRTYYKAKTTTKLNYRTGPSANYKKKGTYKKGKILTIVKISNGWGKTSGGYWVKLSYTKNL